MENLYVYLLITVEATKDDEFKVKINEVPYRELTPRGALGETDYNIYLESLLDGSKCCLKRGLVGEIIKISTGEIPFNTSVIKFRAMLLKREDYFDNKEFYNDLLKSSLFTELHEEIHGDSECDKEHCEKCLKALDYKGDAYRQ